MQILKACEIAGFDKKKRIQYDKDMYDERRFYSELYTARKEGMDEGMEKGMEKGRAEGKAEPLCDFKYFNMVGTNYLPSVIRPKLRMEQSVLCILSVKSPYLRMR